MTPGEALLVARRQVGNVTGLRERSRDFWGFPAHRALLQDVRYALRGLCRSPGFTATVIITLGLGIGANAAMFGVIDRLMFRPYPYLRDPDTVHRVYLQTTYQGNEREHRLSLPSLSRPVAGGRIGDGLRRAIRMAIRRWTGEASRVHKVAGVSASLLASSTPPRLGAATSCPRRMPSPWDDGRGDEPCALDLGLQRRDVVGQVLKVGTLDYTIIGVTPPDLSARPRGSTRLFVPITTIPRCSAAWSQDSYLLEYRWDWAQVLVRRKPGARSPRRPPRSPTATSGAGQPRAC